MQQPQVEMKGKWFISAWMISSILMYGLSFLWHGVMLNDYLSIQYPMWLYFALSAVVYLLIGLVLTYLYHYTYSKRIRWKGALMGSLVGFFIYLIAFVLGVSFNPSSWEHTTVDFLWQMLEQGIGGATVGALMRVFQRVDKFAEVNE